MSFMPITAIVLGVGAVALFNRTMFGRVLIVAGCALTVPPSR
jgi:hypothetical protein